MSTECESVDDLYLTDLSPRDKPWDDHRATTDVVTKLYRQAGNEDYATRMANCSRRLDYELHHSDNTHESFYKLSRAFFCRVRLCPVCQWRRSLKWKARLLQAIPVIHGDFPTHRWLFLTLTVKNCELTDLRQTLGKINTAFERLTKLKQFPAAGWVKSVEVTRNQVTNQAHPHLHCLLLVPASYFGNAYIKQAEWVQLWRRCLRIDYDPLVDIKAIKPKTSTGDQGIGDALAGAVAEVLKYAVKPSDLIGDAEWLAEVTRQLHKTRAVGIGGVLRHYLREVEDSDNLVNITENPIQPEETLISEHQFNWQSQVKRYKLKT